MTENEKGVELNYRVVTIFCFVLVMTFGSQKRNDFTVFFFTVQYTVVLALFCFVSHLIFLLRTTLGFN